MSREYRELLTKSFEPEDDDEQFEEKGRGRGLISGGSLKLQKRVQNRAYGLAASGRMFDPRGARAHKANKYLATRTGRNMFGATPPRLTPGGAWRKGRVR